MPPTFQLTNVGSIYPLRSHSARFRSAHRDASKVSDAMVASSCTGSRDCRHAIARTCAENKNEICAPPTSVKRALAILVVVSSAAFASAAPVMDDASLRMPAAGDHSAHLLTSTLLELTYISAPAAGVAAPP